MRRIGLHRRAEISSILRREYGMKSGITIRTMTSVAVLSAVAFVLAFIEFPVPLSPSFARMDLSDFPALIGAFAYGLVAGVL